jgi:hypothetical protein
MPNKINEAFKVLLDGLILKMKDELRTDFIAGRGLYLLRTNFIIMQ